MNILENLDTPLPPSEESIALSIGNFDGMHLGHQKVLERLKETGASELVVISYSNHPSEVLGSKRGVPRICSNAHKQKLLEKMGINTLYSIPFTEEFAKQTPKEFITRIRRSIPFQYLVLGEDARLGKDRSGTPEVIQKLGEEMRFEAIYVDDYLMDNERLSSSNIRLLIQQGQLKAVSKQLGRPYSILMGETAKLCLPPRNYYPCKFAGVNATAKISHGSIDINPNPSDGIEVKFITE